MPALGLKAAAVMKSRDYLVVVDQAEQVRALSPDFAALAKVDMGIGGTIVTAPGEGEVDYVCRFLRRRSASMRTPQPARYTAHWLPIGRGGWVRTRSARNNSALRGGAMQCTISRDRVKIAGRARLYLHGTLEL